MQHGLADIPVASVTEVLSIVAFATSHRGVDIELSRLIANNLLGAWTGSEVGNEIANSVSGWVRRAAVLAACHAGAGTTQ